MEMTAAAAAAVVVAANHQLVNNHSSPSHAFKQGSSNCIVITLSQNNSPASSSSELDKDLQDLEINTIEQESSNNLNTKLNGSVSMSSSASSTTPATVTTLAQKTTNKNRISSSRTPTRKARRIKFYRNGDKFFSGITIPVSTDRYRSVSVIKPMISWNLF